MAHPSPPPASPSAPSPRDRPSGLAGGPDPDLLEIGHYVAASHPPGSVLATTRPCSFATNAGGDVCVAKADRIEVRRLRSGRGGSGAGSSAARGAGKDGGNDDDNNDDDDDGESDPFPLVLSLPINGRILGLVPLRFPSFRRDLLFFVTEGGGYALISYDDELADADAVADGSSPAAPRPPGEHYPVRTHASGSFLANPDHAVPGRPAECGPVLAADPRGRCLALHVHDGSLTVVPINLGYDPARHRRAPWRKGAGRDPSGDAAAGGSGKPRARRPSLSPAERPLGDPFRVRIEERTVLHMTFLSPPEGRKSAYAPQLALLHQDSRGYQHVIAHGVDLAKKKILLNSTGEGSGRGRGAEKRRASADVPPPGERLRIQRVEGGSGRVVAVPPPGDATSEGTAAKGDSVSRKLGGVLILGQRQVTYHSTAEGKTTVRPTGGALLLSCCRVDDPGRSYRMGGGGDRSGDSAVKYLLGDDRGRLHLLTLLRRNGHVTELRLDALGCCACSSALSYLGDGLVFVGSQFGDSQLVRLLDEPATSSGTAMGDEDPLGDTARAEVLREYPNLGPIVDLALRPCSDEDEGGAEDDGGPRRSAAATCSGVGRDGTVRVVRHGVALRERASVGMGGVKGMWALRRRFADADDAYLVQGFVRETRVLGVQSSKEGGMEEEDDDDDDEEEEDEDEEGGALAEVTVPGFESSRPTLFACNVRAGEHDLLLQVVEDAVRLVDAGSLELVAKWSPFDVARDDDEEEDEEDAPPGYITVASGNEGGQVVVALRGGTLAYLSVEAEGSSGPPCVRRVARVALDREVGCVDLSPLGSGRGGALGGDGRGDPMDVDGDDAVARRSRVVAVGLWDDFSVRLLSLDPTDGSSSLEQVLRVNLGRGVGAALGQTAVDDDGDVSGGDGTGAGRHAMARSVRLITLDPVSGGGIPSGGSGGARAAGDGADMLLVGLGDGRLISFSLAGPSSGKGWSVGSRKEVSLGTRGVRLVEFCLRGPSSSSPSSASGATCILATGDRPTVVYLAGGAGRGSGAGPRLQYSSLSLAADDDEEGDDDDVGAAGGGGGSHANVLVNVAAPLRSSLLFPSSSSGASLCVADDATLRLGTINDVERLHVTSHRLGMTPRRIAHHGPGKAYVVGCIGDLEMGGEANQGNCVRFFDDATFGELGRFNLESFEMILAIKSVFLSINQPPKDHLLRDDIAGTESKATGLRESTSMKGSSMEYRPFIILGTAYSYPDEDEPSQGRVLVFECNICNPPGSPKSDSHDTDDVPRRVRQVAELPLMGGIYSIAPFYDGSILVTCGSKTILCQLSESVVAPGELLLNRVGSGHHGHLLSLQVKSRASDNLSLQRRREERGQQLAIVADLMRSVSLVEYFPKHQVIDELARDYNSNMCTAVTMLTNNIYMGSEGYNNLFVIRYNPHATTEQARVRLDTVGQFHLGEMVNVMEGGNLVMSGHGTVGGMDVSSDDKAGSDKTSDGNGHKVSVAVGSQTLYGTVDGTLGCIIGLSGPTFAFLTSLQRAMDSVVRPVGDLSRSAHRAWEQEDKRRLSRGFVDGNWVETFLDLDCRTMERVVGEMNGDGRWRIRDDGRGFVADARGDREQRDLMDAEDSAGRAESSLAPPHSPSILSVDDILGIVEEISMLH
ncbi:hypothetical protein ACHAWF_017361 [Thalassiosira exigua]